MAAHNELGKDGEQLAVQYLIEKGFDGVVDDLMDEIIVFNPNQIKSATGNTGAFDPAVKDIRGNVRMNAMLPATGLAGAGVLTAGLKAESNAKKKQQLTKEQQQQLLNSRRGNK